MFTSYRIVSSSGNKFKIQQRGLDTLFVWVDYHFTYHLADSGSPMEFSTKAEAQEVIEIWQSY